VFEESSDCQLQLARVEWELVVLVLLESVDYEGGHNVIIEAQQCGDSCMDPGSEDWQLYSLQVGHTQLLTVHGGECHLPHQ